MALESGRLIPRRHSSTLVLTHLKRRYYFYGRAQAKKANDVTCRISGGCAVWRNIRLTPTLDEVSSLQSSCSSVSNLFRVFFEIYEGSDYLPDTGGSVRYSRPLVEHNILTSMCVVCNNERFLPARAETCSLHVRTSF